MIKVVGRLNKVLKNSLGLALLLILLISFAPITNPTKAQPTQSVTHTLSVSTGKTKLASLSLPVIGNVNICFEVTYYIQGQLSGPSMVTPGSTYNYDLTLNNPGINITVFVNGHAFSKSFNLPLGQQIRLPIPVCIVPIIPGIAGITACVYIDLTTSATANVSVSGYATANTKSLQFSSEGTQTFSVSVSPDLNGDNNVTVSVPVSVNIDFTGVTLTVFGYNLGTYNLGTYNLGTLGLKPALQLSSEPLYKVVFIAKGIGSGVPWSVNINGKTYTSTTNSITVLLPYGSYSYSVSSGSPYYEALSNSGTVTANENKMVYVQFEELYAVTFVEEGLPSGTPWQVTLNGMTKTSTSNEIVFIVPKGTYSYSVSTTSIGFTPSQSSGTISVNGNRTVTIQFVQVTSNQAFTSNQVFTSNVAPSQFISPSPGVQPVSSPSSSKLIPAAILITLIVALGVVLYLWLLRK